MPAGHGAGSVDATRCVVSVESLPVAARSHVLKALHLGLGLACVSDNVSTEPTGGGGMGTAIGKAVKTDKAGSAFSVLLHRLQSLSRWPAGQHALLTGQWLPKLPPQATSLHRLHRDLAAALADRLLPGGRAGTRHIMVCMDCCPHEAFESLVEQDHAGRDRDVCLQDLLDRSALIRQAATATRPSAGGDSWLCDTRVLLVRCPAYAADNATDLEELCCRIVCEVRSHMAAGTEAT